MSLSSIVKALAASGCTPEQIAAAVEADEASRAAAEEARLSAKREGNRKRQAKRRAGHDNNAVSRDVTPVTRDPPIDSNLTPAISVDEEARRPERRSDLESRCRLLAGVLPVVADPSFGPVADLVGRDGITEADVVAGLEAAIACNHRLKFWPRLEPWARRAAKDRLEAKMPAANYSAKSPRDGPSSIVLLKPVFNGGQNVRSDKSTSSAIERLHNQIVSGNGISPRN